MWLCHYMERFLKDVYGRSGCRMFVIADSVPAFAIITGGSVAVPATSIVFDTE